MMILVECSGSSNRREVKRRYKDESQEAAPKQSRTTLTNVTGTTPHRPTLSACLQLVRNNKLYAIQLCLRSTLSMGGQRTACTAFCLVSNSIILVLPFPGKTRSRSLFLRAAKRCLVMHTRREIRRTGGPQASSHSLGAELAVRQHHEPGGATRRCSAWFI